METDYNEEDGWSKQVCGHCGEDYYEHIDNELHVGCRRGEPAEDSAICGDCGEVYSELIGHVCDLRREERGEDGIEQEEDLANEDAYEPEESEEDSEDETKQQLAAAA